MTSEPPTSALKPAAFSYYDSACIVISCQYAISEAGLADMARPRSIEAMLQVYFIFILHYVGEDLFPTVICTYNLCRAAEVSRGRQIEVIFQLDCVSM